jgi:hypothetical protein
LRRPTAAGTLPSMDEDLISRDELTATLFAIQDIREDISEIHDWLLEDDDGEAAEENT